MSSFDNMSNVERYNLLNKIEYGKKYRYDFRFLIHNDIKNIYMFKNNSYVFALFPGVGAALMVYNFIFMFKINYYMYNLYSFGFSKYGLLNIDFILGNRFILNLNNNFLEKLFYTNKMILECSLGLERLKFYDPYDINEDIHLINPFIFTSFIFDYLNLQCGITLKIKPKNKIK